MNFTSKYLKVLILFYLIHLAFNVSAAKYYWVGNSGNWSQATTHWATTSGGSTFYISAPTSVDSVYIDANSFSTNGTISANVPADCKLFDASGLNETVEMNGSGSINFYGHFYGNSGLEVQLSSYWNATVNSEIDPMGSAFDGNMQFLAGCDYDLLDTLQQIGTFRTITFASCEFNTNNHPIISKGYIVARVSNNIDSLIFTTGTSFIEAQDFYAQGSSITKIRWNFEKTTFIATSSNLTKGIRFVVNSSLDPIRIKKITASGTSTKIDLSGPKFIVNDLNCDSVTNYLFIVSNFSSSSEMDSIYNFTTKCKFLNYRAILHFDTFKLKNVNGGCVYGFATNSEISIGDSLRIADGLCTAPNTIEKDFNITNPNYSGNARWKSSNKDITVNHYNFTDQTATGTANFTVNNAYSTSGNSVWTINSPSGRKLYWVGDDGNYSDPTEWSYTSGGATLLATDCGPSQFDSVIFDNNSFSTTGFTVLLDVTINSCRFMDWTGVTNNPTFYSTGPNDLKVYGSLFLDPNMNVALSGDVRMLGHFGLSHKIKTANHTFNGHFIIDTKDTLELVDSLKVEDEFKAYSGTFISNDEAIVVGQIQMFRYPTFSDYTTSVSGTSFLGKSQIYVTETGDNYWKKSIYGESDFFFSGNGFNRIYFQAFYVSDSMFINSITLLGGQQLTSLANLDIDARGKIEIIKSTIYSSVLMEEISISHLMADTSITLSQTNSELDTLSFLNTNGGNQLFMSSDVVVNDSIYLADGKCNLKNTLISSRSNYYYDLIYSKDISLNHYNIIRISAIGVGTYTSTNSGVLEEPANSWNSSTAFGQKFYWIGSTGSWSDATKWSSTSGGAPFASGSCTPGPKDSVYFDVNSFTAASDSVYGLQSIMSCAHMDWTGALGGATFYRQSNTNSQPFWFYGSLIGDANLNWKFFGSCRFRADSGNFVVQNKSIAFQRTVEFNAGNKAFYSLKDSISIVSSYYPLMFKNGTFDTEGNSFSAGYFELGSYNEDSLLIHLGNTNFYQNEITRITTINGSVLNYTGELIFLKYINMRTISSKEIRINKIHHWSFGVANRYAKLESSSPLIVDSLISDYGNQVPSASHNTFSISLSLHADGNTRIHNLIAHELNHSRGNLRVDSLIVGLDNLPTTQQFVYNDTIFISDYLKINTSPCNRTTVKSSINGRTTHLVATGALAASGGVYIPIINYKDINALPANHFDVGLMGSDQGNNSGLLKQNDLFTLTPISSTFCVNNIPDTINNTFFKVGERKLAKDHEWYRPSGLSYIATGVKNDSLQAIAIGKHPIEWSFGESCSVTDTFIVVLQGPAGNITNLAQNDDFDSSWFKCKNWNTGLIPDSFTRSVIPNNVTIRINAGDQAATNKLFIEAGGTLEINGGSLSIWDSFENNGVLKIIGNTDTVFLKGTSTQQLCGTNPVNWNRLFIDKRGTGNVVNKRSDSLSNELVLNKGIVKMQAGAKLHFKHNSTWQGGGHTSHIEGPVCKTGTDSFVFPTGDNNWWARIGIDAPMNISDQFCAERFDEAFPNTTSLLAPLNNVSEIEYWNLDRTIGTSQVKVKLFWESMNRSSIASSSKTDLTVVHWNGTDWEDAGNTDSSTFFNPNGWVESRLRNNFSPFTFGSLNGQSVLPLNEIKINAKWINIGQAEVSWELLDTTKLDYFILQVRSGNGEFKTIKVIKNWHGKTAWSWLDFHELTDKSLTFYYRVVAKRREAEDLVSAVKFLTHSANGDILIYPNPSKDIISIDCNKLLWKGPLNFKVYNNLGVLVKEGSLDTKFISQLEFDHKGTYLVIFSNSKGDTNTRRVIIN